MAAPIYPPQAAAQGLEGYVVVSYTVTAQGTTEDVVAIESSDPIFESASIDSVKRYRYEPRVIDDVPVAVPGLTIRIAFSLAQDN
jgi:protein TonB